MLSLTILILFVVQAMILMGWVLARSARAVGSARGRFGTGLLAVFLTWGFGIVLGVLAETIIAPKSPASLQGMGLLSIGAALCMAFFVFKTLFGLGTGRTFAPLGAWVAIQVLEVGLILLVVQPFILKTYAMPSRSMSPTIEAGDRFIANTRLRPQRLDLVVHWLELNPFDPPSVVCKRLVGLPGERLRFDQGSIYINDQPLALPPVLAGRCHASPANIPPIHTRYKDGETIVLGEDEYFLIGDNVDASADSRTSGPSRAGSFVGVVDVVYWPWEKARIMR